MAEATSEERTFELDKDDNEEVEEENDDVESSSSSHSDEDDEEMIAINKQIEDAAREKAEREEKLRIQKEQLANLQKQAETAKEAHRRAKSAKKKDLMLKQLAELTESNKLIWDKEKETKKKLTKLELSTVDSGIESRVSKGLDIVTREPCCSADEEEILQKPRSKKCSDCVESTSYSVAKFKGKKKQMVMQTLIEQKQTELNQLKEQFANILPPDGSEEEVHPPNTHSLRCSKTKKGLRIKGCDDVSGKGNKKLKANKISMRKNGKICHQLYQSSDDSSESQSDESDDSVSESLAILLKQEKSKAKKLENERIKKKSQVQNKVKELERLQSLNLKEVEKQKKTTIATRDIDEELEAAKQTQQQKLLESMAKAEQEQNKRLGQQKQKDIELMEMKKKLEDLKMENKERLEDTIKTASETKLLEDTINSEVYDAERMKLRRKEISQLMRLIKKAQVVDLCFLVDATGSMGSYISEVKNSIKNLVRELSSKHESLKLNIAFVAYRDYCDARTTYGQFQVLDFTTSVEDFHSFVGTVTAAGGGDGPEDVFGGLEKVLSLNWTAPSTRIVMHIADAPCHGSRFHSMGDDYPSGDPSGLTAEDLLPRLQQDANVFTFMFFKLNNHTDKMIAEFHALLGPNAEWLKVYPLNSMNVLMETVGHTISASIATVESSTMSSFLSGKTRATVKKEFTLDTKELSTTDWSTIPSQAYQCDSFKEPLVTSVSKDTISALITKSFSLESKSGAVKIAPNPFAKGALRIAYYALDQGEGASGFTEQCVVKDYIEMKVRENALKKHLSELDAQAVASFLANCFNKVKPRGSKEITFLRTEVLKMDADPSTCLSKEPLISGDYKKFNNNWGWVDEKDYSASVQAFSHWAYEITNRHLIVVDLQGKKSASTFLLTDPVIHSKDLIRFGRTNLGPTGVAKFFKTHICSHVCKAMGLNPNSEQPHDKAAPTSSTVLC